ncbi:unnamed protein product [Protopolystoma xenopodis]|uniref:Uncharacterized protein n=1 Tax=Protopolystoma xenopodis TaxID=117903 RepID=A0A448XMT7_9PLAT|nr:unnamed protein product [Protopolystoma xenopodis]
MSLSLPCQAINVNEFYPDTAIGLPSISFLPSPRLLPSTLGSGVAAAYGRRLAGEVASTSSDSHSSSYFASPGPGGSTTHLNSLLQAGAELSDGCYAGQKEVDAVSAVPGANAASASSENTSASYFCATLRSPPTPVSGPTLTVGEPRRPVASWMLDRPGQPVSLALLTGYTERGGGYAQDGGERREGKDVGMRFVTAGEEMGASGKFDQFFSTGSHQQTASQCLHVRGLHECSPEKKLQSNTREPGKNANSSSSNSREYKEV